MQAHGPRDRVEVTARPVGDEGGGLPGIDHHADPGRNHPAATGHDTGFGLVVAGMPER